MIIARDVIAQATDNVFINAGDSIVCGKDVADAILTALYAEGWRVAKLEQPRSDFPDFNGNEQLLWMSESQPTYTPDRLVLEGDKRLYIITEEATP